MPVRWDIYGSKEYALKNESGIVLVPANVNEVALDDEYIFGISFNKKTHSRKSFIYKKGWPEAHIYKTHSEYQKALEENNLSEFFEIPESLFETGSYKTCEKRIKFDCRFEALDKYRALLETGQVDAYKRSPGDKGIPGSMSRYKNFLDWVNDPRYQRRLFD